jgi:hypothetical protein
MLVERRNKPKLGLVFGSLILSFLGFAVFILLQRMALPSYEASAIGSLRGLSDAAGEYADAHREYGYPANWNEITSRRSLVVDSTLASGKKNKYAFKYVPHPLEGGHRVDAYYIQADPFPPNKYLNHFFIDQTGIIRSAKDGPATSGSEPR